MLENQILNYKYSFPELKSNDSYKINNYESIDEETHKNILKQMLRKTENLSILLYEKKNYIKRRKSNILLLKQISNEFLLSDRTFHLALLFIDKIFLKIKTVKLIDVISIFCLILATKFVEEDKNKITLIKQKYLRNKTNNLFFDEFYILSLLDFDYNITTSYDLLEYFLNYKLLFFENEKEKVKKKLKNFTIEQLCYAYLNNLIEKNILLTLNPIQIVLGIIKLIRKRFGLEPNKFEVFKEFDYYNDDFLNKGYEMFLGFFYQKKQEKNENEMKGNEDEINKTIKF
jgi:hypothetical protein